MAENFEYKQPSLEWVVGSIKETPGDGINLEVLEKGIKDGELDGREQAKLNEFLVRGYNNAFRRCFPRDAFDYLRAQNLIAKNIPNQNLDMENEFKEIAELLKIKIPLEKVTTQAAFRHFRKFKPEEFENYEIISGKISNYISESIRIAHEKQDISILAGIIPIFKLLMYLHKLIEQGHYGCETEYDNAVYFGVDEKSFGFRYLTQNELKENLYKDAKLYGDEE